MSKRADYIREHYALTFAADVWIAVSPYGEISGSDRAKVVREARCRWGHFNFDDEARAFDAIFWP